MIPAIRSVAFGQRACALALATVITMSASAQTSTFNAGSPINVGSLLAAPATGSTMAGMLVTFTFAGAGGTFAANWADIGGGNWGVASGGLSLGVGAANNTFAAVWTLSNNTNNRISSVRFNGAPGKTVFDCETGTGCVTDTPGSNAGRTLFTAGGTYLGSVTGAYSNRGGVGGNAGVGDIYEQLTITFDDILGASSTYSFIADTDNYQDATTVTPEPGTWALMLSGLAAVGVAARRRRTPV